MRKICFFTGTRADYGLLKPLLYGVDHEPSLKLQLLVSGMHLSSEFGMTLSEIENDGFYADEKCEILLSSDSPVSICKSMGLGLISFAEAIERLKPDLFVILGDRFEALSAAIASVVCRVPIAHIHGGEVTFGAIDEPFRHAISKMSHLHFTSTEEYQKRVIQMGELPRRVFNVGALGVENIKKIKLLDKATLENEIDFKLGEKFALVTFHPVTLERNSAQNQFSQLLEAFSEIPDLKIVLTKANADTEGRIINRMIDDFVSCNKSRAIAFLSMGRLRYLSTMCYSAVVVGNSSSGIIEAPSFGVPTVNVGDRQKGRVSAESVIDCQPDKNDIVKALKKALYGDRESVENPYEKLGTMESILTVIKKEDIYNMKKEFYDFSSENMPLIQVQDA